jgi:hypothetical protein
MSFDEQTLRQRLWNATPRTDGRQYSKPSVIELRERVSAEAAVKGRRWYARMLLRAQLFANNRDAARFLIQHSRKLIAESRRKILIAQNNVAFGRRPRRFVN